MMMVSSVWGVVVALLGCAGGLAVWLLRMGKWQGRIEEGQKYIITTLEKDNVKNENMANEINAHTVQIAGVRAQVVAIDQKVVSMEAQLDQIQLNQKGVVVK
jgi:predicted  nucleic acid-binding Zn-ribbon protein